MITMVFGNQWTPIGIICTLMTLVVKGRRLGWCGKSRIEGACVRTRRCEWVNEGNGERERKWMSGVLEI